MGNPFYNRGNTMPGPMGNFQNNMNQFQFMSQIFQGDPKAKVQELLNSGRMTQEQYNQICGMANERYEQLSGMINQFRNMFGGRGR